MHPKCETSRAYITSDVIEKLFYPKGEQFIILDKQYIEYIDSETGAGFNGRWEVHMQEV